MSASKVSKQIMVETDTSVKDSAALPGMKSSHVLSNKLYRDTFTFENYVKTANLPDHTVQTVVDSNGKIYVNVCKPTAFTSES